MNEPIRYFLVTSSTTFNSSIFLMFVFKSSQSQTMLFSLKISSSFNIIRNSFSVDLFQDLCSHQYFRKKLSTSGSSSVMLVSVFAVPSFSVRNYIVIFYQTQDKLCALRALHISMLFMILFLCLFQVKLYK